MSDDNSENSRQLCTFLVGGFLFAVDVTDVQEVIRQQVLTPVPLAPSVIQGLINLRGQIVTAFDMRLRLQLPPRPAEMLYANVVLRQGDAVVSLMVDEIGDVLEVSDADFEPPPETLPHSTRGLVEGVYKLSPLLMLLDTERVMRLEVPLRTNDSHLSERSAAHV